MYVIGVLNQANSNGRYGKQLFCENLLYYKLIILLTFFRFLQLFDTTKRCAFDLEYLFSELSIHGGILTIESPSTNNKALKQKVEDIFQENIEIKEKLT